MNDAIESWIDTSMKNLGAHNALNWALKTINIYLEVVLTLHIKAFKDKIVPIESWNSIEAASI